MPDTINVSALFNTDDRIRRIPITGHPDSWIDVKPYQIDSRITNQVDARREIIAIVQNVMGWMSSYIAYSGRIIRFNLARSMSHSYRWDRGRYAIDLNTSDPYSRFRPELYHFWRYLMSHQRDPRLAGRWIALSWVSDNDNPNTPNRHLHIENKVEDGIPGACAAVEVRPVTATSNLERSFVNPGWGPERYRGIRPIRLPGGRRAEVPATWERMLELVAVFYSSLPQGSATPSREPVQREPEQTQRIVTPANQDVDNNVDNTYVAPVPPPASRFTGTGAARLTEILTGLRDQLTARSRTIMPMIHAKFYNYFTVDIGSKANFLGISISPGTCVSVPLEGEPAPVVQSTGGRIVEVTVKFTELDPVEIAKISTLFRVTGIEENLVSMLMISKSTYRTAGGAGRLRYIMRAMRAEQLSSTLQRLTGVTVPGEFDEPVRIENEILNSLGLDTFIPYSMRLTTNDASGQGYGSFDLTVNFRYLNLRARGESLRKFKAGAANTILPLTCRLHYASPGALVNPRNDILEQQAPFGVNPIVNEQLRTLSSFSTLALWYGLIGLVPVYVLSRFREMQLLTDAEIERRTAYYLSRFASMMGAAGTGNLEGVARTMSWYLGRPESSLMDYLTIGEVAGSALANRVVYTTPRSVGVTRYGRATQRLLLAAEGLRVGELMYACFTDSSYNREMNRSALGTGEFSVVNIAEVFPTALIDLLVDFSAAYARGGKEGATGFITEMATNALALVSDSAAGSSTYHRNVSNHATRTVPGLQIDIGREIAVTQNGELPDFTVHRNVVIIFEVASLDREDSWLSFLSTGLGSLHSRIESFLRDHHTDISANIGKTLAFGASVLADLSIQAMSRRTSGSRGMAATNMLEKNTGEIAATCIQLLGSGSSHAIELLQTAITMSSADTLAAMQLLAADHIPPDIEHSSALRRALVKGNRRLRDLGVLGSTPLTECLPLLAGMFVDDSFPDPKIRHAYMSGVISNLRAMQQALATKRLVVGTQRIDLPVSMGDIWLKVSGRSNDKLRFLVGEAMEVVSAVAAWIIIRLATSVVGGAIAAFIGATASAVILIIICVIIVLYLGYQFITQLFANERAVSVRFPNCLTLSRWFTARIKEAVDAALYIELCHYSGIWVPSALDDNGDIRDNALTSYLDYPIVTVSGRPSMPDFYVSKIEGINESMEILLRSAEDTIAANTSQTDFSSLNFAEMVNEMISSLNAANASEHEGSRLGMCEMMNALFRSPEINGDPQRMASTVRLLNTAICAGISSLTGAAEPRVSFTGINSRDAIMVRLLSNGSELASSGTYRQDYVLCAVTMTLVRRGRTYAIERTDPIFSRPLRNQFTIPAIDTLLANGTPARIVNESMARQLPQTKELCTRITEYLLSGLRGLNPGNINNLPGTITQILMLKSLVGSCMHAVGRPGMAILRNEVDNLLRGDMRRVGAFRSNYLYPTTKVFFIDEDNEAWYLFDDLYSFSPVISVEIHGNKYDASETAVLQVGNLSGILTNVFADQVNLEYNFFTGPSEDTPIYGIMLRVGCRIKIQMGNTPCLSEEDTVFTGEITEIEYGTIVKIVAASHGNIMLEELSPNSVSIYGGNGPLERLGRFIGQAIGRLGISRDLWYMPGVRRVHDIIGYVFNALTVKSSRLQDYTPVQGLSMEATGDIRNSTSSILQTLQASLAQGPLSSWFGSLIGLGDSLQLHSNTQLMENVHPCGDKNGDSMIYWVGNAAWVSYNETAWDVLQELNTLLPNNILTVRPFDTRGTLVWGDSDGYYRFRRATDVRSFITVRTLHSIIPLTEGNRLDIDRFGSMIASALAGGSSRENLGVRALVTYIASIAQVLMRSVQDGTTEHLAGPDVYQNNRYSYLRAAQWLYGSGRRDRTVVESFFTDILPDVGKGLTDEIVGVFNSTDTPDEFGLDAERLSQLRYLSCLGVNTTATDQGIVGRRIRAFFFLLAADLCLRHMREILYSRSTSHRRIRQLHMKMSGKDIVKNAIKLMKPYNAVRLTIPKEGQSILWPNSTLAENTATLNAEKVEFLVPIHHGLKPYAYNTYATFFKNARAFPDAQMSASAMHVSSVMTNLMNEAYAGEIILLGDSRMWPHDQVMLWDANRDLFGLVTVRERTHRFNPSEGYLTHITPGMVTRNQFMMNTSSGDSALQVVDLLINLFYLVGAVHGVRASIREAATYSRIRSYMQNTQSGQRLSRWVQEGRVRSWVARRAGFMPTWESRPAGSLAQRVTSQTPVETISDAVRATAQDVVGVRHGVESGIATSVEQRFPGVYQEARNAINQTAASVGGTYSTTLVIADVRRTFDECLQRFLARRGDIPGLAGSGMNDERFLAYVTKELDAVVTITPNAGAPVVTAELRQTFCSTITNQIVTQEFGSAGPIGRIREATRRVNQFVTDMRTRLIEDQGVSGLTEREIDRITSSLRTDLDGVLHSDTSLMRLVKSVARRALVYLLSRAGVHSAFSSVRWFADFYMLNNLTQNNVILSPLFFRGEPMLSGLEGMTKDDARQLSTMDLLQERFSNLGSFVTGHLDDPIQEALAQIAAQQSQLDRVRNPR